jgi:putative cobalt transporter subunit CbtA
VQAALDRAAGLPADAADPDLFSRTVQQNIGLGIGMIAFGAAVGALFAVAYTICLGRVGRVRPRQLALLIAGGAFLALYLVPFIKYPANPPSIGNPNTIKARSLYYLTMVVASVVLLVLCAWFGRRLAVKYGNWTASLLAGATFVVAIGIVMAVLPQVGHLPVNKREYGLRSTETPQPLRDSRGNIVYPGFPADVLFNFRLYSVAAQLLLWGTIGIVFAPLADRLLSAYVADTKRTDSTTPALV